MRRGAAIIALLGVLLGVAWVGVAAQSMDGDAPAEDVSTEDQPAPDQDQAPAPAAPAVVYLVVTATPSPSATPSPTPVTYQTRKGPRTEQDLRRELTAAGYPGPWTIDALLAAYDRATVPTPTPTPTPSPTPDPVVADCRSAAAVLPVLIDNLQAASKASYRNDAEALRAIDTDVRSRTYPRLAQPLADAELGMIEWSIEAARIRRAWPELVAAAAGNPNGAAMLAYFRSELDRFDGEMHAAEVDAQAAARQFEATCVRGAAGLRPQ